MLIGAAEKAGSEVDKVRQGWASQHWRTPELHEQAQPGGSSLYHRGWAGGHATAGIRSF
ncbi:hypothetical protein [Candidatus Symbiobacter mobilis]|uniref:Uncharacterized protein n=1 Tax=Candidatus Symbiobacter mobilis CR TaxID=946483 RepID=U5NBB3_9BURK|nr:hypothetical protein [Candidatus Symbiobacter mobilis]AGX87533.1 hypothetical protein Cenrod_1447 [Candidatus Symbiobacter mobilis CR]